VPSCLDSILVCLARPRALALLTAAMALPCAPAARADGPQVRIVSPVDGESVAGVCAVQVDVTDHPDVTHVVVYKHGQPLGNDFTRPYRIVWDTRWEPDGRVPLTAKALGDRFAVAESPTVTITIDNTPPEATVIEPAQGAIVGGVVKLHAAATDAVGVTRLRFLISGAQLAEVTTPPYEATWDTTIGPNGRFGIEARAFDAAGNDAISPPVAVRVSNPNFPPVLSKIGAQTVAEGAPLSFAIRTTDPEAPRDTVKVTVTNLPSWATFNPRTMTVTGTPASSEASLARPVTGYTGIRVEACDPEPLCVHEELSITVTDVNRPPTMSGPGDRTLLEGQLLAFSIVRSDPDGDQLTCTAERVPKWLVFDDVRCSVDGTPDFEVATLKEPVVSYPATRFKICDPGGLCVEERMTITVKNVDTSPHLAPIGPQSVDEGRDLRFTVTAGDANADLMFLKAEPVPDGATFVDHRDGTAEFAWTPRQDQGGAYDVTFLATDGELIDEETVTITVRQSTLAISGVVYGGESDEPLSGVALKVFGQGGHVVAEQTTGADGTFHFEGLSPGLYYVKGHYHVEHDFSGRARSQNAARVDPDRREVTLKDADATGLRFNVIMPR
jgi:hypothetical protein